MTLNKNELSEMLNNERFPRSSQYDPEWLVENEMGPNALCLTEWLCQNMTLEPGMRVLDMGCGRAMSSVFLAREFGVKVWATDLWISPTDNLARIEDAGLGHCIFPIHADARSLPYAEGFFDAIVCVDSYFYYGTDDLYLKYFSQFVKPGGQIGIVVPGLMREFDGPLPKHLEPFWAQDCWAWHTVEWWQHLWQRTGLVEVETADTMPEGLQTWLEWDRVKLAAGSKRKSLKKDIEVMEADGGKYMGLIRMVAKR